MTAQHTPLRHREAVRDEWIDYNGHLSEAYYVLIFGHATDAVMAHLGLGEAYRQDSGCSLYTVEAHVRYLREVAPAATVDVATQIVGVDAKRVRLCHEMVVDGAVVATEEVLAVHVDQRRGRASPFPGEVRERIERLAGKPPDFAGRAITMRPAARRPG
jgi:acyl-CoA thioester hydrolase